MSAIRRYFAKQSEFRRHVLTLMSGTSLAQLIPIAMSPILTRVYSPSEFGLYALYMAITAMLSIVATARYEIAIVLPEKDEDAYSISILAAVLALIVSLITLTVFAVFRWRIAGYMGISGNSEWLYVVGFGVFLTCFYQVVYYLANRSKQFKAMALSKVVLSSCTACVMVVGGMAGLKAMGLVVGTIVGQIIAVAVLIIKSGILRRFGGRAIDVSGIKSQAKRYLNFPKYSLLADSLNTASNQIPVMLLNSFFGTGIVGFFNLTQRILGAPLSLVATAVCDVFKQRASEDYARDGKCITIYKKTGKGLFSLSIVPFVLLIFFAPALFSFVFGKEWYEAGIYAQIMAPMFLIRFVASPLSYVLYVAQRQKWDLIWQSALLMLTLLSMYGGRLFDSARYSVLFFSLSYSTMYIIYLAMSYVAARGSVSPGAAFNEAI